MRHMPVGPLVLARWHNCHKCILHEKTTLVSNRKARPLNRCETMCVRGMDGCQTSAFFPWGGAGSFGSEDKALKG